jgi:hypothetical protein
VFQGLLLFYLLAADVLIRYRILWVRGRSLTDPEPSAAARKGST